MASLTLDRLEAGSQVFVDATVFVYHFTGTSPSSRDFLDRCERGELRGTTSVVVLAEVAHRADCGILLDVNNVYVSAVNHGFDPEKYLAAVPADRVWEIHLAGHTDRGSHLLDTHGTRVCDEVWELYRFASRRIGAVASLVEWDEEITDWDTLEAESLRACDAQREALGELA